MGRVILITGGARSGKSAFALQLISRFQGAEKLFIATAVATDDEMKLRIVNHRLERGSGWRTIEAPYALPDAIADLPRHSVSIVDCLTVWLGNIWHKFGDSDEVLSSHIEKLCLSVEIWKRENGGALVIVTNEVGWGIIPADAATRRYRDWAGRLNQDMGNIASEVRLCVAGIPMTIKNDDADGRNT